MRRGDFASAWHISDKLLRQPRVPRLDPSLPRHTQWVWDGRPLAGKRVLVRCYHGLGDTIQFARFLPMIPSRETIVWVQPDLIALLPRAGRFLPLHDGEPEVEYDVDVEIMELAHALRVTLEMLPADVPYLVSPASRERQRRFGKRRIGLLARAGDWDSRRSVPMDLMASLTTTPGIEFLSLQLGQPIAGARDAQTPDVLDLASVVVSLDLVITADTMLAHLAGALAVPTWTLLPDPADWRWMMDRADSPWYPTMRLFRQPRPGDWKAVIDGVRSALISANPAR
jgi:hypothetical protein